ncbi:hypothetical protein BDB00DRAFT_827252 [Zychaea mexicana]|uniref:uncharacterized protein n=1 Tax=Zychaea mexicana TaxID=64656 RepID=UPI0022FDF0D0|nr:uncharacterized protein BDB00DRAFT_827252 [Zychaea mexicana]KAI9492586.1 hypothetical protein BDB00DRAFT_827252 [Zychaea mexicana]
MSSFVSTILQHSANRIDDMPFLGSRSKRQSLPTGSSSGMAGNNYHQQQQQQQHRSSAEYYHPHHPHHPHYPQTNNMSMAVSSPPPSYEAMMMQSPSPTPSTSWTSDMNALADRIKDDDYMTSSSNNNNSNANSKQLVVQQLDRRSISQGLKLVSIAADEYDGGNEAVALDIYLTGLDKILMALPNKTDPKTKLALREKLLSVEERVGILNLASQHNNNNNNSDDVDGTIETIQTKGSLQSYIFSRITTTISTISNISSHAETRYEHVYQEEEDLSRRSSKRRGNSSRDPLNRFKRFGQFVVQMTVTMAILIKQSPLPDIFCFLFGYFIQFLIWFDSQYHVVERVQDFGVECLKMLLQADEEYRLHELVSEAVYMLVAAGLKAVVAFKEAPGYKEQHQRTSSSSPQRRHHFSNRSFSSPPPSPVVKNSNKSRITWSWTPW